MIKEEVQKLGHGLYKIYWKSKHGGGSSLASVGSTSDGTRWMAPTNWITQNPDGSGVSSTTSWDHVKKVKLIKKPKY